MIMSKHERQWMIFDFEKSMSFLDDGKWWGYVIYKGDTVDFGGHPEYEHVLKQFVDWLGGFGS